jgi:hypothetical protein
MTRPRIQPRSGDIYVAQGVSLGTAIREVLSRGAATFRGVAAPRLTVTIDSFPRAHALGYVDVAAPRLSIPNLCHYEREPAPRLSIPKLCHYEREPVDEPVR